MDTQTAVLVSTAEVGISAPDTQTPIFLWFSVYPQLILGFLLGDENFQTFVLRCLSRKFGSQHQLRIKARLSLELCEGKKTHCLTPCSLKPCSARLRPIRCLTTHNLEIALGCSGVEPTTTKATDPPVALRKQFFLSLFETNPFDEATFCLVGLSIVLQVIWLFLGLVTQIWGAPDSSFWAFSLHPLQTSKIRKSENQKWSLRNDFRDAAQFW